MSWYVRYLLLNSEVIREGVLNPYVSSYQLNTEDADETDRTTNIFYDDDLIGSIANPIEDSDLFNDLLMVEKTLTELHATGIITGRDLELVKNMSQDTHISSLEDPLGVGRFTISERFVLVCNLVADKLGDLFTDEGYIRYFKNKYNLEEEQVHLFKLFLDTNLKT
jgi:hypothetical protein